MKGSAVAQYRIGDKVTYRTNIGSSRSPLVVSDGGQIVKLHKSGSMGVAEIRPSSGAAKVSRRLQHVSKGERA